MRKRQFVLRRGFVLLSLLVLVARAAAAGLVADGTSPVYLPLIGRDTRPDSHPTNTPTATPTRTPTPTATPAYIVQSHTNANQVRSLLSTGTVLWAGSTGGAVRWDLASGSYSKFLAPGGLPDNDVVALAVDTHGAVWAGSGSWSGGLAGYKNGAWTAFGDRSGWGQGLPTGWVLALATDSADRKWIGTYRGLAVLDDGTTPHDTSDDDWEVFREADGLPEETVTEVAIDAADRKWIASTRQGIAVLDDKGTLHDKSDDVWQLLGEGNPLGSSSQAIAVESARHVWVGCLRGSGGLHVLDHGGTPFNPADDVWQSFSTADGLADNGVISLAIDGAGRKWVTTFSGLSVLSDGGTPLDKSDDRWTNFTSGDGLLGSDAYVVAADGSDHVWVGTDRGVCRLDHAGTPHAKQDDTWTDLTTDDWLPYNEIPVLLAEGDELMWVGTGDGLVAVQSSQRTVFDRGWLDTIAVDAAGLKWIGGSLGLDVLEDGGTPHDQGDDIWTEFGWGDGLPYHQVNAVAIDAAGRKWLGLADRGAAVLLDGSTPHQKDDDVWIRFTTADGLGHEQVDCVAVEGTNVVWFGHKEHGLSVLDHNGTLQNPADDTWQTFSSADGLESSSVYVIQIDDQGRKWIGGYSGTSVLDDGGTPLDKSDDTWITLAGHTCHMGYAMGDDGCRWIASNWDGVEVVCDGGTPFDDSDDVWSTYSTADGLVDNRVLSIEIDSVGDIWVGTDGGLSIMTPR